MRLGHSWKEAVVRVEARGGACDARDGEDGPKRLCPGCDVGLTVQAKLDAELDSVSTKCLAEWLHPGCKRQSERAPLSTPQAGDMFSLTLSDFVCSDFDSQAGSSNYPKRDCPAENEAWAKFPSVETAPCCSNYTLAIGSLLLMAEYANGGPPNSTLETLIEHFNDKDKKHELFRTWASMQISPGSVPGGSNAANHSTRSVVQEHRVE